LQVNVIARDASPDPSGKQSSFKTGVWTEKAVLPTENSPFDVLIHSFSSPPVFVIPTLGVNYLQLTVDS
jgi:hypothetical protein